jgi:hypothetical protein
VHLALENAVQNWEGPSPIVTRKAVRDVVDALKLDSSKGIAREAAIRSEVLKKMQEQAAQEEDARKEQKRQQSALQRISNRAHSV